MEEFYRGNDSAILASPAKDFASGGWLNHDVCGPTPARHQPRLGLTRCRRAQSGQRNQSVCDGAKECLETPIGVAWVCVAAAVTWGLVVSFWWTDTEGACLQSDRRLVEAGRVCLINYGPLAGKLCVIVNVVDCKFPAHTIRR